jgi:hypothetical protein
MLFGRSNAIDVEQWNKICPPEGERESILIQGCVVASMNLWQTHELLRMLLTCEDEQTTPAISSSAPARSSLVV